MSPARALLALFLPFALLLLLTGPSRRSLPCTSRSCQPSPPQPAWHTAWTDDSEGGGGGGAFPQYGPPGSFRQRSQRQRPGGGGRREQGKSLGCGKRSLPVEPESEGQLHLWQALRGSGVELRVSRHGGAKLPADHRYSDLILHRRMFEHTNRDGVKGFREGLLVAPLSPKCKAKPTTLHIPEQLMNVLPHEDASWKFGSCAVVGNSGRLLHASRGAEIDAHDAIFRINYAPVEGYEHFVGSRTTFDIINAVHTRALVHEIRNQTESNFVAQEAAQRESTLVVFEIMNKSAKPYYARLIDVYSSGDPDSFEAVVMAPELVLHSDWLFQLLRRQIQAASKEVYHSKAMTGWYATVLALQMCGSTDVYGFSPYVADEGHWHGRYHYFDTDIQPSLQSHSFDMAYEALRQVSLYPCAKVNLTVHLDN